jgi:thymidylate synthase
MNSAGNIGRAYSHNLESHRKGEMNPTIVKIKPRIIDSKQFKKEVLTKLDTKSPMCEKVYNDKYYKTSESDHTDDSGKKFYNVQFIETGYETIVRADQLGKAKITDIYTRTLNDNGYIGDISKIKMSIADVKILNKIWESFVEKDNVVSQWHCFATFLSDSRMLPNYHLAKEDGFTDWVLDISYYGSNGYSKESCVFLLKKDVVYYINNQSPCLVIKGGTYNYFMNQNDCAKHLKMTERKLNNSMITYSGGDHDFIGYADRTFLYRKELSRNQVNSLLHNLKSDPFGRRHIISFWNWSNIDKKELVECAYETLWSVRKKNGAFYIDMTLVQRSNDMIVAGAINKIQYVAFMMMVASHVGYKVGKFCHLVQNLHIYDRHIEAANEIMKKDPILGINPRIELNVNKNFYDFNVEDFEIYDVGNITKIVSPIEIAI